MRSVVFWRKDRIIIIIRNDCKYCRILLHIVRSKYYLFIYCDLLVYKNDANHKAQQLNIAGVQQAWMVSAVQLRDVRHQFPVGLVRRQFLVRAILDDPISAETSRTVSTSSCLAGRHQYHRPGIAALQLCPVDVRCPADSYLGRTRGSLLSGASASIIRQGPCSIVRSGSWVTLLDLLSTLPCSCYC